MNGDVGVAALPATVSILRDTVRTEVQDGARSRSTPPTSSATPPSLKVCLVPLHARDGIEAFGVGTDKTLMSICQDVASSPLVELGLCRAAHSAASRGAGPSNHSSF
jgi:hypothetical protein